MLLMVFFVVSMNIFISKGIKDATIICTIKLFIENNFHFEGILSLVLYGANSHCLHKFDHICQLHEVVIRPNL